MATAKKGIDLPITREVFEGLYAMWKMGADEYELAHRHGVGRALLAWCFLMHSGDGLVNHPTYRVHFKDPN